MIRIYTTAALTTSIILLIGCTGDWVHTGNPPMPEENLLWVLDQYNQKIVVFDDAGNRVFEQGRFPKPMSVDIYQTDGSAWICDYYGNFVRKYNYGGTLLFQSYVESPDSFLKQPTGLDVDQNDGSCWVADRNNNRVVKFDADGDTEAIVSGFNFPRTVSVDPVSGDCWVADEQNGAVVRLPADVSGEVDTSAVETLRVTGFNTPRAVAGDAFGGCWIGDIGTGIVTAIQPTGSVAATLTGFDDPQSIFVDSATADIYVADIAEGVVARFSPAVTGEQAYGEVANLIIEDAIGPASVWAEPTTGNIYVADQTGDTVLIFDDAGGLIREISNIDDPVGVAYWINLY
jgi:DNA-binding beta-propeller fold protein YncE